MPLPDDWGKAASEVIRQAGVAQAAIARRLKISSPVLNRYLTGQRVPSRCMVEQINSAIAHEVNLEAVAPYLRAIAEEQDLVDPEVHIPGTLSALDALMTQFRPSDVERQQFALAFMSLTWENQSRISSALNTLWRKQVLGAFLDRPQPPTFDGIAAVFRRFGVTVGFNDCDFTVHRASENVKAVIHRALLRAGVGAVSRNAVQRDVLVAHDNAMIVAEERAIAIMLHLTRIRRIRSEADIQHLNDRYGRDTVARVLKYRDRLCDQKATA